MSLPSVPFQDSEAIEAATRHWLESAVIGLNLCPFAKAVHVKKQIRYVVTLARDADGLLAALECEVAKLLQAEPDEHETTLLIHPLAMQDFLDYHFFIEEANAALERWEVQGTLQVAGFHPGYQFADSEPDDMANFTNRSPYPMLHLLREASVAHAVAVFPDVGTIYRNNIRTLRALGYAGWRKL